MLEHLQNTAGCWLEYNDRYFSLHSFDNPASPERWAGRESWALLPSQHKIGFKYKLDITQGSNT